MIMFLLFRNSRRSDLSLFCLKLVVISVISWFKFVDCLKHSMSVDLNNSDLFLSEDYTKVCDENNYMYNSTCCKNDEFQCGFGTLGACIPINKVCNYNLSSFGLSYSGYYRDNIDCTDASDEIGCSSEPCSTRTPKCPQNCIDLPNNKSQCSCYKGYQLQTYLHNISCVDVDECSVGVHSCSHDCINLNGTFECSCREGFQKNSNKSSNNCYVDDVKALVLFYELDWIYYYNLETKIVGTIVRSGKVKNMDYDPATDILYWTNSISVTRSYIPGAKNGSVTIGSSQALKVPKFLDNIVRDSLAIDWVAGNLYWLSSDTFNESVSQIMVSKLDGRYVKTIITIPKASSLVLDPEYGRMYWACGGDDPHIGKAWMNGMVRSTVVHLPNQNPIALTLDHLSNGRLYWVDSLHHTIYCIFKVGSRTRKVFTTTPERSPISLDVFENNLYWTTKESKELLTINKFGKGKVELIFHAVDKDTFIKVYHKRKIEKDIKQGGVFCSNQCSHLCLHLPGGYFCNCPDGYKLVHIGNEMVCDNELEEPLADPLDCNCRNKKLVNNISSPYSRCPCTSFDGDLHVFNSYVVSISPLILIVSGIVVILVIAAAFLSFYKKDNVSLDSSVLVQTRSSVL